MANVQIDHNASLHSATKAQPPERQSSAPGTNRLSPLNRRPIARRLVTIFRGPSNTGKTHLALSMAAAGVGRICVFDTEYKTRNVLGVNERFDAIESDPDTLLEDIQWAIDEKKADGSPAYGGLVLDSWNGYFDTLYGRAIEMAEQQRGEGARLTTSEVELLQTKAKKVLDLLCRVSRRWVAITEHAVPQGQELDENEAGQLIIMTIGGTDYYSDVTFDLSLVLGDDFRAQHIATVVKTNVSHLYPLGHRLVNLSYRELVTSVTAQEPIKQFEPSIMPTVEPEEHDIHVLSLNDLLEKAGEYGIAEVHMSKAAARYCNGKRLDQLSSIEIESLYNRLLESREPAAGEPAPTVDEGTAAHSDVRGAASRRNTPVEVSTRASQRLEPGDTEKGAPDEPEDFTGPGPVRGGATPLAGEATMSGGRSNGRVRS